MRSAPGNITPLHLAVSQHNVETFRRVFDILLESKCDLNSKAFCTQETPLYLALQRSKPQIAMILIQHGADFSQSGSFGITVLQKSSQIGDTTVVELLLYSGIKWSMETWLQGKGNTRTEPKKECIVQIREWKQHVLSLQTLCRIVIRKCLGNDLRQKLEKLLLPKKIQQFIMLMVL